MAVVGRLRKFHFGPSKAGWSLGYASAVDSNGRTIWIADVHRDDGKRFVVRADKKLTAFIELESGDSPLTREGGGHIALLRDRAATENSS
jgi:hypothetical protein